MLSLVQRFVLILCQAIIINY